MNSAPSASQYHEGDFVATPEWPAPSASNIQNWPKPGPSNIQNNQRRLSIGRRMSRAFARYAIVLLIGIGATLAWQSYGDESMEMVRTEAPSLAWLLPVSKVRPPPDGQESVAAAVTAELVQRLKPMALDLAILRRSVEQLGVKVEELAAKQDQMSHSIVLQSVEQGQKLSSPPQPRVVPRESLRNLLGSDKNRSSPLRVLSLSKAQHKAIAMFRKRLKQRKMARLEVHVRKDDAALIRNVIRALANPDQERATRTLLREHFGTGQAQGLKSLLAAAPLEGIDLRRGRDFVRKVEL